MVKEEIEKLRKETKWHFDEYTEGYNDALDDVLSVIRSSEENVSEDLEKEFYDFLDTLIGKDNGHLSEDELFRIAEYFFELGLKARKGE